MATAAPPALSNLAERLLRRPPSLRELIVRLGYAEDYAWFAGLARRLFHVEAETMLAIPDVGERLERFARLFEERHFPLYTPYLEFFVDEGEDPPFTWLRRGIPFQLMGIGYDGLHEMWDGCPEGLSALALLAELPDFYSDEPGGLRTAWLEYAAQRIPQETLLRIPTCGIPLEVLTEAVQDTGYAGAAQAAAWVRAETGNFFLDHSFEDGDYDGFSDPWEEEIIQEGTKEWQRASALVDSVVKLADWLEGDLASRFAELLEFILPRLLEQDQQQEENDDDDQ